MEKKTDISDVKIHNDFKIDLYSRRAKQVENFYTLPMVKYIKYINDGINSSLFNPSNETLYYFFDIDSTILSDKQENSFHISESFDQNNKNNVSLDLLIAYSVWYASNSWFTHENGKYILKINEIKQQSGLDIDRNGVNINGQIVRSIKGLERTSDLSNAEQAKYVDRFNLHLMRLINSFNEKIDMNNIIKFDILTCQNMFNFLLKRCIQPIINKKLGTDQAHISGKDKSINIIITPNKQQVILNFNSIILYEDKRGEVNNVGNISYELIMDLIMNSFKLTNFTMNYDIVEEVIEQKPETSKVQPEDQNQNKENMYSNLASGKINEFKQSVSNIVGNNKPEVVALATTVGLAGLGSLLLTGVLGGKAKTNKNRKSHKKKHKTKYSPKHLYIRKTKRRKNIKTHRKSYKK